MDKDQQFYVHIVVHRGSIHDTSNERRIGLWFVPCEQGSHYYVHVKGAFHSYQFEMRQDWDPTCTGSALPPVYIGKTDDISADELVRLLKDVPIENNNLEFNGQQWIWGALKLLASGNHLTRKQRDDGFNRMLETVLEGSSDELLEPRRGHVCRSGSDTTDV
ncbi:hypothetical protein VFPPC_13664 [Pochonia chlamydosporia 170]|uniref:Uncharacterized protein n=1 Tax=Pochonia chlamydosporia 170 TaxID=1380566 RepID=A0A179FRV3_METCM|nr:hypothetical protein VFPPC_13664 [Pochonia chlamydosporia 170]OAQ68344.1 hypothetical protein VFPPC_13664 [Pochonia chlamydosporia 170]